MVRGSWINKGSVMVLLKIRKHLTYTFVHINMNSCILEIVFAPVWTLWFRLILKSPMTSKMLFSM